MPHPHTLAMVHQFYGRIHVCRTQPDCIRRRPIKLLQLITGWSQIKIEPSAGSRSTKQWHVKLKHLQDSDGSIPGSKEAE